jgi:hypothetical protein
MYNSRFKLVRVMFVVMAAALLFCSLLVATAGDPGSEIQARQQSAQPATFDRLQAETQIAELLKLGESDHFEPAIASLLKPDWEQREDKFFAVNQKAGSSQKDDRSDYRTQGDNAQ